MASQLTQQMIGAAVEVYRVLGPGCLEAIHEEDVRLEFGLRCIPFSRQGEMDVGDKELAIKGPRIDLLVGGDAVVELKGGSIPPEVVAARMPAYLKATGLRRGWVNHFSEVRLVDGVKGISLWSPYPPAQSKEQRRPPGRSPENIKGVLIMTQQYDDQGNEKCSTIAKDYVGHRPAQKEC